MEFDEIVVKESPGLCRCCLSEGCYKDMGTEYTWMNENEVYADMLLECFDIGISQHNEGPNGPNRLICEVCITRLRDACNFKKQVLDSEKKFVDMVGRGEYKHKVLIYQTQMKAEASEEMEDTEVEYLEEDIADYVDEEEAPPPPPPSSSAGAGRARGRPRKSAPDNKRKLDERPKTSKAVVKGDNDKLRSIEYTVERRRANLQILLNNTGVIPFKWKNLFTCFYCGKHTTEVSELREHTKTHGDCTLKEIAIKKLRKSEVEVKLDVSELKCKLCNVCFVSLADIIDHLVNEYDFNYDKTVCMYTKQYNLVKSKCPECEQSFVYSSHLVNHVEECHPIRSYPCEKCFDDFCSQEYLDKHMESGHESRVVWKGRTPLKPLESDHELSDLWNNPAPERRRPLESLNTVLKMSNAIVFKYDNGPECVICGVNKYDFELLRFHMKEHNNIKLINYKIKPDGVNLVIDDLKCRCSMSFEKFPQLLEHLTAVHCYKIDVPSLLAWVLPFKVAKTDEFSCEVCEQPYTSIPDLVAHMSEHLPSDDQPLTDSLCPKCGMTFTKPHLYRYHMRKHLNPFECPECNEDFLTELALTTHRYWKHSVDRVINEKMELKPDPVLRKKREKKIIKLEYKIQRRTRNELPNILKSKKKQRV